MEVLFCMTSSDIYRQIQSKQREIDELNVRVKNTNNELEDLIAAKNSLLKLKPMYEEMSIPINSFIEMDRRNVQQLQKAKDIISDVHTGTDYRKVQSAIRDDMDNLTHRIEQAQRQITSLQQQIRTANNTLSLLEANYRTTLRMENER